MELLVVISQGIIRKIFVCEVYILNYFIFHMMIQNKVSNLHELQENNDEDVTVIRKNSLCTPISCHLESSSDGDLIKWACLEYF